MNKRKIIAFGSVISIFILVIIIVAISISIKEKNSKSDKVSSAQSQLYIDEIQNIEHKTQEYMKDMETFGGISCYEKDNEASDDMSEVTGEASTISDKVETGEGLDENYPSSNRDNNMDTNTNPYISDTAGPSDKNKDNPTNGTNFGEKTDDSETENTDVTHKGTGTTGGNNNNGNTEKNTEESNEKETESESETERESIGETESKAPTETKHDICDEISTVTSFSFMKYNIDGMPKDYDWYDFFVKKGYKNIETKKELEKYGLSILNSITEKKAIKYIIAPRGSFDDYVTDDRNDNHFYTSIGLDGDYYICSGVAIYKFKKIQDVVNSVTDKSVYAIYYFSYESSEEMQQVWDYINEIKTRFTGTDYDKIKGVHDFICINTEYDLSENDDYIHHTAYGALINKSAVCEGYAKAYKLLLNAVGIESEMVINETHAWNEVKLMGEWYFVDITNDDNNSCYCYFLLGRDVMTSQVNQIVDGFVLDEENSGQISYYGYKNGENTSKRDLTQISYHFRNYM